MQFSAGHTNVPVAIVGMACRLPGADNIDQYWRLIVEGGSVVAELPPERLDQAMYFHPERGTRCKTYSKLGAICNSRQFHRDACPISPELEKSVDLAHLLTCEVAAAALRHAKMDPFNLPLRNTGVYIGHAQGSDLSGEYVYGTCIEEAAEFLRDVPGFKQLPQPHQDAVVREVVDTIRAHTPKRAPDSPDLSIHMVAGTISKAFGLTGPYLAVNSACASSLQTMLMATRALQLGRIDMAIVGGASDCKGDTLVLFSHAQSMSTTGSRPFDADADGLICGEGYVALVLKTLPRALADGDPIQAIVMGLGASSDGRGKSLWAPRKEGQVAAMERAYHNGLDMASLQYIEAHATSTNLGDATELGALAEVLATKVPAGKKIPVTSVKANIGHTLESAGISGVIKTVMSMQNRTIAPAINITSLNSKIDWPTAPIYVPLEKEPWPEQPGGLPRRAAVNAFGIGGLNVHVVLEEFTEARRAVLRQKHLGVAALVDKKPEEREAVAIIGVGCIFPGALHPTKFWDLLSSGRDPKGHAPAGRWRPDLALEAGTRKPHRTPSDVGGYITDFAYDWKKHKVPPKQVEQADPLQFMLLEAADQALADSGYDKKKFDRTRVGVMVGTEFASDFGAQLEIGLKICPLEVLLKKLLAERGVSADAASQIAAQYSDTLLNRWPALIDETGSFSTSTLASRITKTMDLMGGAAAMDGGHSSAVSALAACVDSLLSGDCDMMFCASGQRCMSLAQFEGMSVSGVLASGEKTCSPLDAAADGIVPGEGVGVLLLKRLSDARRDDDRIHAIIRGIGAAHATTAEESLREAASRALGDAGITADDVALLEFDGIGVRERDEQHLRAMISVYGQPSRKEPLLVSTVVGQIGHTCGASAMASLIKASMEMENGQMPGTPGFQSPMPILAQNANVMRVSATAQAVRHATADGRQFAAVSSYGKGMAFHIVLERGEKVPVAQKAPASAVTQQVAPAAAKPAPASVRAPQPAPAPVVAAQPAIIASSALSKIVRFGAVTPDALAVQIQQAISSSAAVFASADSKQFSAADRFRLAVVADSADALAKKLDAAAKQINNPAAATVLEQQGCFYRQVSGNRPRIAFLFSGQGSHYPGMLRELVRDVPAAAAVMQRLDAAMTKRGFQTFAQMAWENAGQLGTDVWATQVVMLLADLIMHSAVTELGIHPDLVSGHSYGEFPALTAAGVWDIETVVAAARARYDSIEATPNARGTLMAVTAAAQQIEQLAGPLRGRVHVANINSPEQTVVGGHPEHLRELAKLLESHRIKSQMLTVPAPYHTPLMEGVGAILRRTLDTLPMHTPRVAMLSSVTNRYVAEPDEIRANLAAQLTTTLRYLDLVARIAGEQDTVLVEVGPQQNLTRLNRRILEGKPVAGIIACDNPKRPGIEQLLHVKALLECTGALAPAAADQPIRVAGSSQPRASRGKGTITHVDATQRRREKMRQAAVKVPAVGGSNGNGAIEAAHPSGNGSHLEPAPAPKSAMSASRPSFTPAPNPRAHATSVPVAAQAPIAPAPTPAKPAPMVTASTATKPQAPAPTAAPNLAELEQFLINFVVEQTGYPPEVVELDADLEADLGIDSIKKAQMFGELREYFDVTPTDDLTLDDFPTLRHIVNFLAKAPQKGVTPTASEAPASVAPVAVAQAAVAVSPAAAKADTSELEQFLINFVVEQTGYPPEVVELDADLEADLGIDSIKKAQMFGELREYFDVTPTDDLTLDDFPTLRHIVNFLAKAPQKGTAPSAPTSPVTVAPAIVAPVVVTGPVPAPAAPSAVDTTELEQFLINFVVEQTGYPPEVVELDADLEADLGIDSIKKAQMFGELREYFDVTPTDNLTLDDFPTLRHIVNFLATAPQKGAVPSSAAATPRSPEPAPAPVVTAAPVSNGDAKPQAKVVPTAPANVDTSQLEQFLINFVVEQTGYPPEVVELDADLEADLGIDSIKKAQMFGELREYFDVTPTDNLTLDDFPTLRHIVNFLATAPQKGAAPLSTNGANGADHNGADHSSAASAPSTNGDSLVTNVTMTGGSVNVDVLHARGTAYEIGRQHGAEKKTEIRRILRRIADLTDGDWGELPIPHQARQHPEQFFAPDQLEELRGIAEAVDIPLANLAALNLAVHSELAANCAQVAVILHSGQTLHGLVGDISLPPALVELLSPFILVREPAQGWACATMTFAGIAGSLVGVNGSGLAVSAGAVLNAGTRENTTAHSAAALRVESLLERSDSIARAISGLRAMRLPGGWTSCLSHQGQQEVRVAESDGRRLAESNGDAALIAANHCILHPAPAPPPTSSVERLQWLQQRMAADNPESAVELLALLAEAPSKGTMQLAAVVDAANGDFLLDWGDVRERIHVGALLSPTPIGDFDPGAATVESLPTEASQPTSDDLHVDRAIDGQSMRFTMRMRPYPWPHDPPEFPVWKGAAAVYGNGPHADALAARLQAGGASVVRLAEAASADQAVAEFERAAHVQPIMHLFLTSLRDAPTPDLGTAEGVNQLVEQRLLAPYFVCQRMFQLAGEAKRLNDCTVVVLVDLGGDFGFSGRVTVPESGFFTGMMKGLFLEHSIVRGHKEILCKAIDAPGSMSPADLAANVCRELAGRTNDYEVTFAGDKRYVQVALPVPAPLEQHSTVRPGGTWVLTGGARGITAQCGLELGRRFGLKLHLIGASPLKPIDPAWRNLDTNGMARLRSQIMIDARNAGQKFSDVWAQTVKEIEIDRNLLAFAASGIQCTYHTCDVGDRKTLARVLDEVRAADGPIEGILHGAGIERARVFEKKTRADALATLRGKIEGAINLMELTRSDPVRHFIGFGSTSGRLGGNGQGDYSAASDMLCKLVSWYRAQHPDCHAVGFHWHPWDEVGMASRPETAAMLKSHDLVLTPSRVGVRHLLRELFTMPAETEVLITDWEYHQRFYPKDVEEIARRDDLLGARGQIPEPAQEVSSADESPTAAGVAQRVVLRAVDAPLSSNESRRSLPEAVLIQGNNADAEALAGTLTARGVKVHRLPETDDPSVACEALDRLWRESPVSCLMLLTARDPQATQLDDPANATLRIEHGVHVPYWVTRRWFELLTAQNSSRHGTLVAVTSLGGDFGFETAPPAPEGGALSGLLKSIYVEDERTGHTRIVVKAIDFPADEPPAQLAASVCRELESGRPEVEVAWSGDRRRVVATLREPASSLTKQNISRGGNWIVTGGGRGITAAAALELGRQYGVKLHLLGKSPAPDANAPWRNCTEDQLKAMKSAIVKQAIAESRSPTHDWERVRKDREIQETLDKFHQAGVSVTYHACDVADWKALAATLERIRAADGPIDGVIHGAGYGKPFRFGTGPVEKLRRTVAPKVDGTLALMHLTAKDPLRYFIAFGSLGGRFGGNGLTDYAAANDMLAKLCGWFHRRRPDCQTTCLHWQTWDAVGMANESEGVGITKNTFKMTFIPPAEGVQHLLDELQAGVPENEVLISDGYFEGLYYPYKFEVAPEALRRDPGLPAAAMALAPPSPSPVAATTGRPLISSWQLGPDSAGVGEVIFDPVNDPFLTQHRLKDKPFLPGVISIETLAEAASLALGGRPVKELRDIRIVNGLTFNDTPISATATVTPLGDMLQCSLTNELRDRRGRVIDLARPLATASVPVVATNEPILADPPGRSPNGWFNYGYFENALMYHGPALRCLDDYMFQYDGGWGKLTARPQAEIAGSRSADGWLSPVALIDACVVCCAYYLHFQFAGVVEVPFAFERLRWSRIPAAGENCILRLFFRGREGKHSLFDFTLFTEADEPLVQATGYRTVLIGVSPTIHS